MLEFKDFMKGELRVAKIIRAEAVPKAKKLLRMDINLGDEERQIVAGIAEHYTPEDLEGRTIVVVANLKPATIRGVESNGMLLAASDGDQVKLLTVEGELPPGSKVN